MSVRITEPSAVPLLKKLFIEHVRGQLREALKPTVEAAVEAAIDAAVGCLTADIEMQYADYKNKIIIDLTVNGVKKDG